VSKGTIANGGTMKRQPTNAEAAPRAKAKAKVAISASLPHGRNPGGDPTQVSLHLEKKSASLVGFTDKANALKGINAMIGILRSACISKLGDVMQGISVFSYTEIPKPIQLRRKSQRSLLKLNLKLKLNPRLRPKIKRKHMQKVCWP
jgi:hypothetical protein